MGSGFELGSRVDLDLQSQQSCGHDLYSSKRSEVSRFERFLEWKWTDGGNCFTSRANAVGNKTQVALTIIGRVGIAGGLNPPVHV